MSKPGQRPNVDNTCQCADTSAGGFSPKSGSPDLVRNSPNLAGNSQDYLCPQLGGKGSRRQVNFANAWGGMGVVGGRILISPTGGI